MRFFFAVFFTYSYLCTHNLKRAEVNIVKVDFDRVEPRNLSRSILFTEQIPYLTALEEGIFVDGEAIGSMQKMGLNNVQKLANAQVIANAQTIANAQKDALGMKKGGGTVFFNNSLAIGSASKVMEAFNSALNNVGKILNLNQNQNFSLNQTIGNVISQTAAASNSVKLAGKAGKVSKKVIK